MTTKQPLKPALSQIDNDLIQIIFKYRDTDLFFDVKEREHDRQTLEEFYDKLQSLSQKILDSRCYLELGKVQNKQTCQLLLEQTTPGQRLGMVAYLVRTLTRPVLFISGRNQLLVAEEKRNTVSMVAEPPQDKTSSIKVMHGPACRPDNITVQQLQQIKQTIQSIAQKYGQWQQWRLRLSLKQAEVLSQMAASQELTLERPSTQAEWVGTVTSTVLREQPSSKTPTKPRIKP